MKLSRLSVEHPVIIGIVLVSLILFGLYSLYNTNMEFMSDISLPQIYVITVYVGASAEEIEDSVINVMEDDFVTLPDFKSMTSSASSSVGSVIITFSDGIDPYDKINDVRNRVDDLMDDLPDGIQKPQVLVGGSSMLPVATFSILGGEDLGATTEYINDTLKPKLTRIDGVSTIDVYGGSEAKLEIQLRMDELNAKGISPLTVYQILSYSNLSMPLGTTEYQDRDITIRYDGKFRSIDDIEGLPLGANSDGTLIYLKDVADIALEYDNKEYTITQNGKDVIYMEVCKRSNGNTVKITREIKKVLDAMEKETGGALRYDMISDDSDLVLSSLKTVIVSGLSGVLIAIVVIFLFLNDPKATLVIGLSIPLSIFFTFIGMKLSGITVNLMSISGITVALGSIVDASIVVLDQVYRYYQGKKEDGSRYSVTEAIYRGSGLVDKSVLGSNLTTVVVFIPLLLITGIVGSILHDVSLTFMISILSSLIVALVFVPWILKYVLKEDGNREAKRESLFIKMVNRIEKGYNRALGFTLRYPSFILAIGVGVLLITLYTLPQMNTAFIPSTDNNDFYVTVDFPYGYRLEDTKEGMEKIEKILLEVVGEENIQNYLVYSGKSTEVFSFSNKPSQGGIHVLLVPVGKRKFKIQDIIKTLQYELQANIPDATLVVSNGGYDRLVGFISGGGGYGLKLIGDDQEKLYEAALQIQEYLLSDPEVVSTAIDCNYDDVNAVISASNDYLSSFGLTSYEAGMTSAILFNGMDVGSFTSSDDNKRYEIHLSSDILDYPVNESTLSLVTLTTQAGSKVALPSVSDLIMENNLSEVNHTDRNKSVTVTAQLTTESAQNVTSRVDAFIRENPLPDGVESATGGIGELVDSAIKPILEALIIAIFLVYFVMVVIFERYKQPFLVMLTVPFCVIGVALSLALFGSSLNLVSMMGVISLAGMLVNNGIIMVDYINQLERQERTELLNKAGVDTSILSEKELMGILDENVELEMLRKNTQNGTSSRLRPILMSSLTTILGVIPMAMAIGEGSEVYAPLGQVIMGGLTTSMLITLFIMPVFYYLAEKSAIKKLYRKKAKKREESGEE